ncbi:MAG: beta-lactamase family protein [Cytophagaceae bacterium]|nr:beta-lactamase family protein [Gemmatimonadaceae bacterium]
MRSRTAAVVLGFCVTTPAVAQDRGIIAARIDTAELSAAFRAEMAASGAPGATIAIVVGERIVYRAALGVRSSESGDPMTPGTLFRLGSVTKSVTGLAAALMAAEGRVDLHAPIARHAPALHPLIGVRTLHQLLSHTSGLADAAAGNGSHDDDALEARVRGWGTAELLGEPGDIHSYASPGYWLSGYVLQQADGLPYADLVERRVLRPLGMRSSTFRPLIALTHPLALDHRVVEGRAEVLRPYQDDVSTWPSGSLFSSVEDLARYAIALLHEGRIDGAQVLPAGAVRAMFTPHGRLSGSPCGYSYGLSVCTQGTYRTAAHYGFRVGSGAVFTLLPDQQAAVIILANRNGGIMRTTEAAAVRMLVGESAPPATTGGDLPRAPTPADRQRFVGTWTNGGYALQVVLRGDSLVVLQGASRGEQRARLQDPEVLLVLDGAGNPVQQLQLIVGARSGRAYLHDGLSALARTR